MTSLPFKSFEAVTLLCLAWWGATACSNSVQLGAFNGESGEMDSEDVGLDVPGDVGEDAVEDTVVDVPDEEAPPDDECVAMPEICNGEDDDCDGEVDEALPDNGCGGCEVLSEGGPDEPCRECGVLVCDGLNALRCEEQLTPFYRDSDEDGFGDDVAIMMLCGPQGFHTATQGGDCDDTNPDAFPEAPRRCDGVDNNCDDVTDESCCDDMDSGILDVLTSPPTEDAVRVEVAPHTNGDFMTVLWTEVSGEELQAPGLIQAARIEAGGLLRTGPTSLSDINVPAHLGGVATPSGVHILFLTDTILQSSTLTASWSANGPVVRARVGSADETIEFAITPRADGASDFAYIADDSQTLMRLLRTGRFVRDQRSTNAPLGSRPIGPDTTSPRIASNTERAVVVVQLSQTVHVHRLTSDLAFEGIFIPLAHDLANPVPDVALSPSGGTAVVSLDRDFNSQSFGVRLVLLDEGGNLIGDTFLTEDAGAIFGPPRILTVEDGMWVVWPEGNPLSRIVGVKLGTNGEISDPPRTLVDDIGELSRVRLDLALGRRVDVAEQIMVLAGSHKTTAQDPFEPFVLPLDLHRASPLCFSP